jgi:hypothetical protein
MDGPSVFGVVLAFTEDLELTSSTGGPVAAGSVHRRAVPAGEPNAGHSEVVLVLAIGTTAGLSPGAAGAQVPAGLFQPGDCIAQVMLMEDTNGDKQYRPNTSNSTFPTYKSSSAVVAAHQHELVPNPRRVSFMLADDLEGAICILSLRSIVRMDGRSMVGSRRAAIVDSIVDLDSGAVRTMTEAELAYLAEPHPGSMAARAEQPLLVVAALIQQLLVLPTAGTHSLKTHIGRSDWDVMLTALELDSKAKRTERTTIR